MFVFIPHENAVKMLSSLDIAERKVNNVVTYRMYTVFREG